MLKEGLAAEIPEAGAAASLGTPTWIGVSRLSTWTGEGPVAEIPEGAAAGLRATAPSSSLALNHREEKREREMVAMELSWKSAAALADSPGPWKNCTSKRWALIGEATKQRQKERRSW